MISSSISEDIFRHFDSDTDKVAISGDEDVEIDMNLGISRRGKSFLPRRTRGSPESKPASYAKRSQINRIKRRGILYSTQAGSLGTSSLLISYQL